MKISRREVLKLQGWGCCRSGERRSRCATLGRSRSSQQESPHCLATLFRSATSAARDVPGTLAAVGEMGYQGVEFAGYYNRSQVPRTSARSSTKAA